MSDLAFRDGVMDRIRLREPRFHEAAFLFVLAALEFCQTRLPNRRHISGAEVTQWVEETVADSLAWFREAGML